MLLTDGECNKMYSLSFINAEINNIFYYISSGLNNS